MTQTIKDRRGEGRKEGRKKGRKGKDKKGERENTYQRAKIRGEVKRKGKERKRKGREREGNALSGHVPQSNLAVASAREEHIEALVVALQTVNTICVTR